MEELSFRKTTFELSACSRYELSIQASLDGFLFSVVASETGEILWWESRRWDFPGYSQLLRRIGEEFDSREMPGPSFSQVRVHLADPRFALIPQPLFSGKMASRLMQGEKSPSHDTELVITALQQADATLVFPAAETLLTFFRDKYPGCLIGHELALLIRNFGKQETNGVFIHLHDHWFSMISFRNGKADVVNTFEYHSPGDLLYYLLSFLSLPGNAGTPVTLSGRTSETDERFLFLKKHIPGISLFHRPAPAGEGLIPGEIPEHLLPGVILL